MLTLSTLGNRVMIEAMTWARDSHGLFDYETKNLTKNALKAEKSTIVMQSDKEVHTVNYDESKSFEKQVEANKSLSDDKALIKIVNIDGVFYLESVTCLGDLDDPERA